MPSQAVRDTGASAYIGGIVLEDRGTLVESPSFFLRMTMPGPIDDRRMSVFFSPSGTKREGDPISLPEWEFWMAREAFLRIPAPALASYAGQFVLSKEGVIADHDADLAALTRRSVERFGDAPIYITRIGGEMEFTIDTPFVD